MPSSVQSSKKTSLDPNNLKNYRPVSNIKFLSKVIEKYVVNTICNYMRERNLERPLQSAYRTAHSTEFALLKVKNDIMTSIYHREGVSLVLLGLSAAFDTVTHSILFHRMEYELGIKGTALMWLKSYFVVVPPAFPSTVPSLAIVRWTTVCHRAP